jgi:hypothetical protein
LFSVIDWQLAAVVYGTELKFVGRNKRSEMRWEQVFGNPENDVQLGNALCSPHQKRRKIAAFTSRRFYRCYEKIKRGL